MKFAEKENQVAELVQSLETVYELKSIRRSGWIQSGISELEVESIAAHSYGMSILILYLSPTLRKNGLDVERALNMALIHDIAESIVGDLTPLDTVSAADKNQAESEAFAEIMVGVSQGEYFRELWEEFEAAQSREAMFVKRIDKLDMLLQAFLYEKKILIRLDSFWEKMDSLFKGTECEPIYKYIVAHRFKIKGSE